MTTAGTPEGQPQSEWCIRCGETELILGTDCPSCGVLPLCPGCLVEHVSAICDQEGRTLGP